MTDVITNERKESVEIITLNRPDKLNSFTDEMHLALRTILENAQVDKQCRAILLTGAGRAFCAGQDLGDRDPSKIDTSPDLTHTIQTFYNPLIRLIRDMPKPIICAVNGVAAGAGANIALACDIVLAGESAKFIQSFVKVGLIPDAGGSWSLTHLIGEARARAIAMTATPVPASQAADWGMIYKAVPDNDLMEEAFQLAQNLSKGPTMGLAYMKQAIQAASNNSLDEQLELEAKLQGECGRSGDYAEGVSSFLEKRAPIFKGT